MSSFARIFRLLLRPLLIRELVDGTIERGHNGVVIGFAFSQHLGERVMIDDGFDKDLQSTWCDAEVALDGVEL